MSYKAIQFNTDTNQLDLTASFDPSLVYPLTPPTGQILTAKGTLSNGNLVSLIDDAGALKAKRADASSSCIQAVLPAHGFVLSSYSDGQPVQAFLGGLFTATVPGATVASIGSLVYLSDVTPGDTSLTPPTPNRIWTTLTLYNPGDTLIDTNGNWETTSLGGTSGVTQPNATPPGGGNSWATVCGNATTDGSVTWTMSPPHLAQVIGVIVYFNAVSGQCTIDFQPVSNTGNVSSVGLSLPADFGVGGSPIVSSGTIQVVWLPQAAHFVHAGPASAGPSVPTWRLLVAVDLPAATNAAQGAIILANDLNGVATAPTVVATHLASPLPLAQGGTAANLSATGGAKQVLQQTTVGGPVTVGVLSASSISNSIRTISTSQAALATDGTILCTGSPTLTLPVAGIVVGQTFRIKDIGTGVVTVSSSVNIDFATSLTLTVQGAGFDVQWDGSQWWIL